MRRSLHARSADCRFSDRRCRCGLRPKSALGEIAVAQNFFWVQDKNLADPHKSGVENLAKAIDLNAADDSGWEVLAGFANEASAAESPQRPGVFLRAG